MADKETKVHNPAPVIPDIYYPLFVYDKGKKVKRANKLTERENNLFRSRQKSSPAS